MGSGLSCDAAAIGANEESNTSIDWDIEIVMSTKLVSCKRYGCLSIVEKSWVSLLAATNPAV